MDERLFPKKLVAEIAVFILGLAPSTKVNANEPPGPQIEQEHDRGGTTCGRSEQLGRGPPRCSQDRGEEAH
jgi:hypothetical protein